MDWAKRKIRQALANRQWLLAVVWCMIFVIVITVAELLRERLASWANEQIDLHKAVVMSWWVPFISSPAFSIVLFGVIAILWVVAFFFLWKRLAPVAPLQPIGTERKHQVQPMGNSQTSGFKARNDAIGHLLIGTEKSALTIYRGKLGWPVQYPIKLRNTRPVSIEVVRYEVTIFMNDVPMQVVQWDNSKQKASNGADVSHPIYLQGDDVTSLPIWVLLAQMRQDLPQDSPKWGSEGELSLQGDDELCRRRSFDLKKDYYALSQADWEDLRKNAILR